jgi:hypothetical protein
MWPGLFPAMRVSTQYHVDGGAKGLFVRSFFVAFVLHRRLKIPIATTTWCANYWDLCRPRGGVAVAGLLRVGDKLRIHVQDRWRCKTSNGAPVCVAQRWWHDNPHVCLANILCRSWSEFFGVRSCLRPTALWRDFLVTFLNGFTTVIALLVGMSTTGNSEEDVNWNRIGEQSDVWG